MGSIHPSALKLVNMDPSRQVVSNIIFAWDVIPLVWICSTLYPPTLENRNGLKLRDEFLIQAKVIVLSVKNLTSVNCNLDSSYMDLAKRLARRAACSSKRRMVSCFVGATLLFATTNLTACVSSSFF